MVLVDILYSNLPDHSRIGSEGKPKPPKLTGKVIFMFPVFKGSSDTSHTSKYFGSIDSSENNHKEKVRTAMEESEHFIKYVLQDPIWLLMADADDSVMMTYQLPSR
jgi:hypothetical protein